MTYPLRSWFCPAALLALCCTACRQPGTEEKSPAAGAVETTRVRQDTAHQTSAVKYIVFFGNSLTAGYGVEVAQAFPSLIQEKIDSLHLHYKVVNAGLSGETTSGGRNRIGWILQQPVDIFILELGGNDGLRGIPLNETERNLQAIVDQVREQYPAARIILAGMQIPPNMGPAYAGSFRNLFRQLAQKNRLVLIPFLLEGVGGIPELNQADGIHPNVAGHRIVADNVWRVLKRML